MEVHQFPIAIICPWCGKGKTLANALSSVTVLCHCFNCGNYYQANFKTLRAVKARAAPRKK